MNKFVKKIIYAGSAMLLLMSAQSCGDYFDVGNNPNLVTEPNINSLLSTVTHRTGINSRTYAGTTSFFTQYLASPSEAAPTDTYQITNLSTTWTASYYTMADLHDMITMGELSNAYAHIGIGKLLMAYNLNLVVSTWDAAPYTEAFMREETITPAYDSGESLHQVIGQLIQEGIEALGQADEAAVVLDGSQDLIHGGSVAAWLRTGYGLLARHLNKTSKKPSYEPAAVLAALDNSYTSSAHDMTMGIFTGNNPWAAIAISNEGSLLGGWLSSTLVDHLNGATYGLFDPRLPQITDETVNGVYVGTPNGRGNIGPAANTVKDECYISTNSPVTSVTSPIYIMTFEELKFVEAEAALRANQRQRAYDAYLEGIRASMAKLEVGAAEQDAYIGHSTVSVGADALTIGLILKEKYVATYLNFEAWIDARRYDYAYEGFGLPYRAELNTYIRQVAIPFDELTRNPDNVPNQVSLDTPLWWDQP